MVPLRIVSLKPGFDPGQFPYSLPVFSDFHPLPFAPVTFLVGENGSGKSTLLEALAVACRLPTAGSNESDRDETLSEAHKLASQLSLVWNNRVHRGFFLRAEDFFGFIRRIHILKQELKEQKEGFASKYTGYGRKLAVGSVEGQLNNLESRYGDLNTLSHGEGFIRFFQSRLIPGGLFLLDEPEAALSPTRQLSLISLIKEQVAGGSQFIIATHSPLLMAFPESKIFEFSPSGIREVAYDQVDHVIVTRAFLSDPANFLRRL